MKGLFWAPEQAGPGEKGQVMFKVSVERLTTQLKGFSGVLRVGWASQAFFSNGEALSEPIRPQLCNSSLSPAPVAPEAWDQNCSLPQQLREWLQMRSLSSWRKQVHSSFLSLSLSSVFLPSPFLSFLLSLPLPLRLLLFLPSPEGRVRSVMEEWYTIGLKLAVEGATPIRNGPGLEAEGEQMVYNLDSQPPEASALVQILGSSQKKKGIGIMATGNERKGIALLGRIWIHKQENKKDIFLLLLSLVLTHFSEAAWFMWKDSTIQ